VLGSEYLAVQVSDPLPPRRRHVQVRDGFFQVRRDAGPVKVGKALNQIRRRGIAKPAVEAELLELVIKGIGLLQVEKVAKLADQVSGLDQPSLPILQRILRGLATWEARELDRPRHPLGFVLMRGTEQAAKVARDVPPSSSTMITGIVIMQASHSRSPFLAGESVPWSWPRS
jgi:hypothetical protein